MSDYLSGIESLSNGDAVLVTDTTGALFGTPKTMALHVTTFGDGQSTYPMRHRHVSVGFGPGGWNVTVSNDDVASGRIKVERG